MSESSERVTTEDLAASRSREGADDATRSATSSDSGAAATTEADAGAPARRRGDTGRGAATQTAAREGDAESDRGEVPSLFPSDEASGFLERWGQVQSRFVDDPRRAVRDGDALVAEVMQALAASFARHKQDLESQWSSGDVHTEGLRQALQRYRAFFQRLLSAGG